MSRPGHLLLLKITWFGGFSLKFSLLFWWLSWCVRHYFIWNERGTTGATAKRAKTREGFQEISVWIFLEADLCPPPFVSWSLHSPAPQNMTLFRKRVMVDGIGSDEVILDWGWPLIQHYWCPLRREDKHRCRHTDTGECHVTMKAEIAGKPPEAWREAWGRFSLPVLRRK